MVFVKVANDTLKGGTSLCLQIQSTDKQRIHFLVTGLLSFSWINTETLADSVHLLRAGWAISSNQDLDGQQAHADCA